MDPHRIAEVVVRCADGTRRRGSGYRVTGTAVLTAAHVIAGAEHLEVRFDADRDGQWSAPAGTAWHDPENDLAVLVFAPPPGAPPVAPARYGRLGDRRAVVDVHAAATRALETTATADLEALGQTKDTFRFFLAFAGEVMDRYGRLLAYLHPSQPDTPANQRLDSYNERLLQQGWVTPYFIWPNINPFRKAPTITDAVPAPGSAADLADSDPALRAARTWTQHARTQHLGLHDAANPLRLQPFELRFIARRQPPDRWVLDLARHDKHLLPPQAYIDIPHPEDRLYIPAEYVPLWQQHGWQRG
jgi:endonuclease YncB( thermonuclease family)